MYNVFYNITLRDVLNQYNCMQLTQHDIKELEHTSLLRSAPGEEEWRNPSSGPFTSGSKTASSHRRGTDAPQRL